MAATPGIQHFMSVDEAMSKPTLQEQFWQNRITELESALRRYGRHLDTCAWFISVGGKELRQCTCGFAEALNQPGESNG